ncbi:hypothetical protein I204_01041 [Kwoniella mangroviensis CBS 8886]|nr:hypothetical protein I204_01041 [Kwoniella mangroviensis CBS 8886]
MPSSLTSSTSSSNDDSGSDAPLSPGSVSTVSSAGSYDPSIDLSKLNISPSSSPPVPNTPITPIRDQWRISPHRLRLSSCPCTNLKPKKFQTMVTSEDYLKFNMDRFDKLLTRLCKISNIPRIAQNVELVLRGLRERGYELFHFVGRTLNQEESGNGRSGMSICLMVPDPNNILVGHKILAEILIHSRVIGKGKDQYEIASRFYEDYTDWILIQPYEYLSDTRIRKFEYVIPDKTENKSRETIINDLLSKIRHVYSGLTFHAGEIIPVITRTTKELMEDGRRVYAFEMELVYRKSSTDRYIKMIRIGLKVFPSQMNKSNSVSSSKAKKEEEIGAIILLELRDDRIKNTLVMYKDDWPVFHSYRDVIPPPDLSGLERLIEH